MYLFDNELFAIECIAKYAMEGLDVKKGGVHDGHQDEFAHCPIPRPKGQKYHQKGDAGYYLTWEDHQHQGLLQSVDMDRHCFYTQDVVKWLATKPPRYEELAVIFKRYISGKYSYMYGRSGELSNRYKKPGAMLGRTGALHPRSRAIIVIKPDGTKLHFGSIAEAARKLGIPRGTFGDLYLSTGKPLVKGKWEGYQFFYAAKE